MGKNDFMVTVSLLPLSAVGANEVVLLCHVLASRWRCYSSSSLNHVCQHCMHVIAICTWYSAGLPLRISSPFRTRYMFHLILGWNM